MILKFIKIFIELFGSKKKMNKIPRVEKYAYIDYEKRLKIIELIDQKGYTIQRTANILGIKPSTARMIMKKYRESG